MSRLRSVEESVLWLPNPVLAPERPPGTRPTTFSIPPAPLNCSPVSNPSAPQPLAAMHVIKRGERLGRGQQVTGEQVNGLRAAAALAVGHTRPPLPLPARPAAASRPVKPAGPLACVSLFLPSPPHSPPAGLQHEPPLLCHPAAFQKNTASPLSSSYSVHRAFSGQLFISSASRVKNLKCREE